MKRYKPTSKSRRQMSTISFGDFVTVQEPHKALTHGERRRG
jgi:ribosomal protein L2